MLTPRAYWDQDHYLWEQHPEDPGLLRWVWSPDGRQGGESGCWVRRWALEFIGLVLVPTC